MSPEGCRPLGEYVGALVQALASADRQRMHRVVDGHRALIALDGEAVETAFDAQGRLAVAIAPTGARVDGEGATDTATVLALLDGHLEVNDAILDGRLRLRGRPEAVVAIFQAIEILLDASARNVALQALASAFRTDPCHAVNPRASVPGLRGRSAVWGPEHLAPGEAELLARLDLLPG